MTLRADLLGVAMIALLAGGSSGALAQQATDAVAPAVHGTDAGASNRSMPGPEPTAAGLVVTSLRSWGPVTDGAASGVAAVGASSPVHPTSEVRASAVAARATGNLAPGPALPAVREGATGAV